MKNSEPVRHHYIPQFILRNFCCDDKGHVCFYNKKQQKTFIRQTRDVFMTPNLYRDEINHPDEPSKIEKDFSKFECEAANIINKRFLNGENITLSKAENDMLKLFFAIMGLRSDYAHNKFNHFLSRESKDIYSLYQGNNNLEDFWKRNLGNIIKCRSIDEVLNNKDIDVPFKIFMHRDTEGHTGSHIIIADSTDSEKFLIGDCYPVVKTGILGNGIPKDILSLYPLSPNRILILANNGAENCPRNILILRSSVFHTPNQNCDDKFTFRVKHLKDYEVEYINSCIKEHSDYGYIVNKTRTL